MEIEFLEPAIVELFQASDYYGNISVKLKERFKDEVDKNLQQISQHPESSPKTLSHIRKAPLKIFPYSIMYSIRGTKVLIIAIANQKRKPFYFINRIDNRS